MSPWIPLHISHGWEVKRSIPDHICECHSNQMQIYAVEQTDRQEE